MSNTKIFIAIFIVLLFVINFFTSPSYGCDLVNNTGYKGSSHKGLKIDAEIEQRVQDAICQAIQDIEQCPFLNDFQKNKIRSNMGKRSPFSIEFNSFSGCGDGKALGGIITITESLMYDDTNSACCSLKATIGHELLHLWYPLGGDKTSECKAYKIEQKCLCKDTQTPTDCDKNHEFQGWVKLSDNPDDNHSFSSGNISDEFLTDYFADAAITGNEKDFAVYYSDPDVMIYNKYNFDQKEWLIKNFEGDNYLTTSSAAKFSDFDKILVIPTGELMEAYQSELFKAAIERFVKNGGTLLVFAQQYGSHIDNVVPVSEGESLKTYGWRQDSSCLKNSIYFESPHPVLSSSTYELTDAGVDGYFSIYPSNSTILLKRKTNLEPALLYYPYGNGTVILTSMFTDWAYAHSQATNAEIKIIRDLITFAKNPHLPIPIYNLEENPTPGIDLNVSIINKTAEPSTKAKLVVYTPDRKTVLYETEAGVNLDAGEFAAIPVHFILPELQTKDYGICHADYELYNAENELIQLPTESDSGRFSIYKIITPVTIKDGVYQWITVKDENIYWGWDVGCTIHFKNTTSMTKTLDLNNPFFLLGHGTKGPSFPSFQVILPPGGEYERAVLMPTTELSPYPKYSLTFSIQYYDSIGTLSQPPPAKVIFLLGTVTESTLKLNTPSPVIPGGTLNYSITSRYIIDPLPGNTNIKVTLEKYNKTNSQYNEIQALYQVDHNFTESSAFQYNGSYTPNPIHINGEYRLKLEVIAPNGLKEPNRYNYFNYSQSSFSVVPGTLKQGSSPLKYLIPGASYTIPIKITNKAIVGYHAYDVKNGCFELLLESPSGQEVYRKAVTGISIASGDEQTLSETFIFNPLEKGKYILKYRYWDESKEEPLTYFPLQYFLDGSQISIRTDKSSYNYGETANITVLQKVTFLMVYKGVDL